MIFTLENKPWHSASIIHPRIVKAYVHNRTSIKMFAIGFCVSQTQNIAHMSVNRKMNKQLWEYLMKKYHSIIKG